MGAGGYFWEEVEEEEGREGGRENREGRLEGV